MSLKNTHSDYGLMAKGLHWTMAALLLASYVSVYYRHWFTQEKTPENWTALQLHLSVGMTIAVFVTLRIVWRMTNVLPDPESGTRLEHLMAHIGHYALYLMMIIMPVTGYLGTGVNTEYFFLFDIIKFENTLLFETLVSNGLGLSFKEFEQPIDFLHKKIMGEWLVWLLILGHICAALYHHFIKKDRTLYKMTINKQ